MSATPLPFCIDLMESTDDEMLFISRKRRRELLTISPRTRKKSASASHDIVVPVTIASTCNDDRHRQIDNCTRAEACLNEMEESAGWKSNHQMQSIVRRSSGKSYKQFRISYLRKSAIDSDTGYVLSPGSLVIKEKCCTSNLKLSGTTSSLLHWKLLGTSSNQDHISIFESGRPRVLMQGNPILPSSTTATAQRKYTCTQMNSTVHAHPIVVISSKLPEKDRDIIFEFFEQAEPGTTIQEYCQKRLYKIPANADACYSSNSKKETKAKALQTFELGKETKITDKVENPVEVNEVLDSSCTQEHQSWQTVNRKFECSQTLARAIESGDELLCSNKRKSLGDSNKSFATKGIRAKRLFSEGKTDPHQCATIVFEVPESHCFAILEGVGFGSQQTYFDSVFFQGLSDEFPCKGRLRELNNKPKAGSWFGRVVSANGKPSTLGLVRDRDSDLTGHRILLRHSSMNSKVNVLQIKDGSSTLSTDISYCRTTDIQKQGLLLSKTSFIGSLSIVSIEGFSSCSEAESSAAHNLSTEILSLCRVELEHQQLCRQQLRKALPDLMRVPAPSKNEVYSVDFMEKEQPSIGVTILTTHLCKNERNYTLLMQLDEKEQIVALDVIFCSPIRSVDFESDKFGAETLHRHERDLSPLDPLKRFRADFELGCEQNVGILNDPLSSLKTPGVENIPVVSNTVDSTTINFDKSNGYFLQHKDNLINSPLLKGERNINVDVSCAHKGKSTCSQFSPSKKVEHKKYIACAPNSTTPIQHDTKMLQNTGYTKIVLPLPDITTPHVHDDESMSLSSSVQSNPFTFSVDSVIQQQMITSLVVSDDVRVASRGDAERISEAGEMCFKSINEKFSNNVYDQVDVGVNNKTRSNNVYKDALAGCRNEDKPHSFQPEVDSFSNLQKFDNVKPHKTVAAPCKESTIPSFHNALFGFDEDNFSTYDDNLECWRQWIVSLILLALTVPYLIKLSALLEIDTVCSNEPVIQKGWMDLFSLLKK